jgi:hypothetical protein
LLSLAVDEPAVDFTPGAQADLDEFRLSNLDEVSGFGQGSTRPEGT